jgi:hypothetical protein
MKKVIFTMLIIFVLTATSYSQIGMSVYGGISTPNNQLNLVYANNPNVWSLLDKGMSIGWHLGARFRMEVDDELYLFGGLGWNRFNDVQLQVKIIDSTGLYTISAQQDIIPISAGLQYYITDKLIKFYVIGQLNYNYFTTHGEFIGLPAPNFDLSVASNRGGFTGGIGIETDALIINPFLEFNY